MSKKTDYVAMLEGIDQTVAAIESDGVSQLRNLIEHLRGDILNALTSGRNQTSVAVAVTVVEGLVSGFRVDANKVTRTINKLIMEQGRLSLTGFLEIAGISNAKYISSFKTNPNLLRGINSYTANLMKGLSDKIRTRVVREIRATVLGQKKPIEAMKGISEFFGGGRKLAKGVFSDAERIIRTESHRVFNVSYYDSLKKAKADFPDLQKQWVSALTRTTRDDHRAAHGQIRDVNEPFIVGGEALDHPLDPNGSAENTIYCKCRAVTVHPAIGALI